MHRNSILNPLYQFSRLPPEILVKILSHLDASALLSLSHTNKLFHQLASNNNVLSLSRNLNVTWELTITDMSGCESTLKLSWSHFSETSVTLCWCGGNFLPDYKRISSLELHGVRRIALCRSGLKKPNRKSLMAKMDMQLLTKSPQVIGQDQILQLELLQPGIIFGLWKRSVAFIMFTLHFYKLVERSIQGSSDCYYVEPIIQAPFDDIDPEYGLHGYQLHIVLHNAECKFMSESFSQLFCRRGNLFLLIISKNFLTNVYFATLSQNCCIMSLTLLDEFRQPFSCVASPVSVELEKAAVSYDYDGEHYLIRYESSDIQVKMQLVKTKKKKQLVISLIVYVSVCFVNKHFRRDY
uniref:F-box domain-containing protein n=1 Tax=Cyprinodon variegatus TaxID=28743 RepID=A0A3Q2GJB6_CYPVA